MSIAVQQSMNNRWFFIPIIPFKKSISVINLILKLLWSNVIFKYCFQIRSFHSREHCLAVTKNYEFVMTSAAMIGKELLDYNVKIHDAHVGMFILRYF